MTSRIGARRVMTPSGTEWRVGRRWFSARRPRLHVPAGGGSAGDWLPLDIGGIDDIEALIVFAVLAAVVVLVVLPLLLFGIELIIVGVGLAAGLLGRFALGRPWLVRAIPIGEAERARAWEVKGWRRSGRVIEEVAGALAAGREPRLGERVAEVLAAEQISAG